MKIPPPPTPPESHATLALVAVRQWILQPRNVLGCNMQRSRLQRLLKVPKTNLKTIGERSFGYIAPTVWNSLPADLRASPCLPALKANLKTYLFRQAF